MKKRSHRLKNRFHTSARFRDRFKTREAKSNKDLSFDTSLVSRSSKGLSLLKSRVPIKHDFKPFKLGAFEVSPQKIGLDKKEICKQRQERKEVLFALGKAGKGGAKKAPVWTASSYVRCN